MFIFVEKFTMFCFLISDLSMGNQRVRDYDTGIGSTSTIMSPIGSPYGQIRSQVKTNGHFTSYMQVSLRAIR